MNHTISICLLMAALALSGNSLASENEQNMDHSKMEGESAMQMQTQMHKSQGVVNKIDLQHSIVNLTHGPIKSLGWSGMTMDFSVKDPTILKQVKVGQKVNFEVVSEGPGKYFVTRITPAK